MITTPLPRAASVAIPRTPQTPQIPQRDFALQAAQSRRGDAHGHADPQRDAEPEPSPPQHGERLHAESAEVPQRDSRARTAKSAQRRSDTERIADGNDVSAIDAVPEQDQNVLTGDRGVRTVPTVEPESEIAAAVDLRAGATAQPETSDGRSSVAQGAHASRQPRQVATPHGKPVARRGRAASKPSPTGATRAAGEAGAPPSAVPRSDTAPGDAHTAVQAEDRHDGKGVVGGGGARAARLQATSTEPEPAVQRYDTETAPPQGDGALMVPAQRNLRESNVRAPRRAGSKVDAVRATPSRAQGPDGSSVTVVRDIVVDLAQPSEAPVTRTAVGRDGAMAQTLVRRLADDVGAGVVRQANVLLSGSDRAEIRLIIRPPELGRVRIQLSVDGDHIAGRILVDNGTVRQAIEQHVAQLQRSFAEAGLELGEFEVSSGGPDQHAGEDAASESGADTRQRTSAAAVRFESAVALVVDHGQTHINVVA